MQCITIAGHPANRVLHSLVNDPQKFKWQCLLGALKAVPISHNGRDFVSDGFGHRALARFHYRNLISWFDQFLTGSRLCRETEAPRPPGEKREYKSRPAAWKPEDGAEVTLGRPSGKGCAQRTINIIDFGQGASMAFRPCARTAKSRLPPSPHGDHPEDSLPRRPWPDHQSQGGPPAGQNG